MGRTPVYLVGPMKRLLTGKNDQLGWELQHRLGPLGEVLALDRCVCSYCGDLGLNPRVLAEKL